MQSRDIVPVGSPILETRSRNDDDAKPSQYLLLKKHDEIFIREVVMKYKIIGMSIACLVIAFACARIPRDVQTDPAVETKQIPEKSFDSDIDHHAKEMMKEGRKIFRYDTFGSEEFWGDRLRLHEAVAGSENGGVGPGLTPKQALQLGLKVDSGALPKILLEAIKGGHVSLEKTKTTIELLKANAVVGLTGFFDKDGRLRSIGIQCAFCHSTVDNSLAKGIGRRLDGWPNRDLNVGAIVAMAPKLKPMADALKVDEATVRKVLNSWGPGKYDAELNQDGKAFRPDGSTAATLLPAAFGLAGVNLHTYTGWGSVTYWNAYVANTQMHGKGTFFDPRLKNPAQFPIGGSQLSNIRQQPDLITDKLAALHFYQLSIPAPTPPKDSFDEHAAARGKQVFEGRARCAQCHVPPLFTEPGWNMHSASEIGIDDFQANRSPDKAYRTTPLKGLFTRMKGGFYHDGRFARLEDLIDHYDQLLTLGLKDGEKTNLAEYLKSL
jgi:hypothetical protein